MAFCFLISAFILQQESFHGLHRKDTPCLINKDTGGETWRPCKYLFLLGFHPLFTASISGSCLQQLLSCLPVGDIL